MTLLKTWFLAFAGFTSGGVIAAGIFAFLAMIIPVGRIPLAGETAGQLLMTAAGLGSGVFVGCLVMSLAETVKAVPVLNRRLHLSVGIQYMILAIALGKMAGALVQFCLFSQS